MLRCPFSYIHVTDILAGDMAYWSLCGNVALLPIFRVTIKQMCTVILLLKMKVYIIVCKISL